MKRLLLGPALLAPLMLFSCNWHKPALPKVPEVVRQIPLDDFNAFPSPPQITVPHKAPAVKRRPNQVKPHASVGAHHRPLVLRPVPPPAPPEELPPQQGPICIFPLNFIPNCKPQEIN